MKTLNTFVSIGLFLFLSLSCQRQVMSEMDRIESLLDSNPDSALVLIEGISTDLLKKDEEKARYSLLYSIALDKNYIDLQNDSIIHKAVNYYSSKSVSQNRMKTLYYGGRIQSNSGNYASAIVFYERAEKDAAILGNNYYTGLINGAKASIYNEWVNLSAAIECQEKALSAFQQANLSEHTAFCLYSLGVEWQNNKDYDNAIYYFNEAKKSSDSQYLTALCDIRLASVCIEKNEDPSYALSIFNHSSTELFALYDYGYCALAWERVGKQDSAYFWMNKGYEFAKNEADSASLDYMFSGIDLNRGNYEKAYSLVKHATDVMASTTQSILQESLNTALKDYYQSELALEEVKNARERESRLWMGIIGGLILLGVVAIFVHRLRSKDKLLELQIAQYAAVQRDNAHLIGSLISQRLRHMDKLSDEYFTADEKKKKDIVFASFKSYLEEFRNDKDAFKSLEDFLNKYSNGIMDKLEKQVPRINGDNRRIISLFFAGLPYETIQLIFKRVSIGSLRTLRSRFRLEIKNANAPDAKLFLLMLETKKGGQQTNKK